MSKDKLSTQEKIKKTAEELFFGQGNFKATTQEIADAAGVNRTSINYYFRSRDKLFELVLEEAIKRMQANHWATFESDLPFREKLERYIDDKLTSAIKYPFLEIYIVTELHNNQLFQHFQHHELLREAKPMLDKQLKIEIEKGRIRPISSIHFLLNISSLVSFPFCIRPLIRKYWDMTDEEFDQVLKERKQIIMDTIFIDNPKPL